MDQTDDDWGGDAISSRLTDFLKQRGASVACPSCGKSQWKHVHVPEHTGAVPLIQDDGAWVAPPARIPVYVLVCANCAFVRMHAKIDVDEAG